MERTVTYPESKQADHKQAIHMPGDFKHDLRHHSAMSTSLLTMMLLAACSNGSNNRGIESGGSPAGVVAPVFTSPEIGLVDEDETDFSHRFVATSDVAGDTVTYSITGGADASSFEINSATGELTAATGTSFDHESKTSYEVTVTAIAGSQTATQTFTLIIKDVNDTAPVFTSSDTALVDEDETDFSHRFVATSDVAGDTVTYSITGGADASAFDINSATGEITAATGTSFDHESKTSYEVTVTAIAGSQTATQTFTLNVTDVNDIAPVFAADTPSALTVEENTILPETTFTATGDVGDVVYSLSGADASAFVIDSASGALIQPANTSFDYDIKTSYSFDVVATVGSLSTNHAVTVSVTDIESIAGQIYLLTLKADHLVVSGRTDDLIFASGGYDVIFGGGGNDFIHGHYGNNVILGEDGNDVLFAWNDDDIIRGGSGHDLIYGYDGEDKIYGGTGNDLIIIGEGNEIIDGGSGDDLLILRDIDSTATITGGAGADFFVLLPLPRFDTRIVDQVITVTDYNPEEDFFILPEFVTFSRFSGNDVYFQDQFDQDIIVFKNYRETYQDGLLTIRDISEVNEDGNIVPTLRDANTQNILEGNDDANVFLSGGGNDVVFGLGGNDTIRAGSGNDYISGDDGDDTIYGEAGNDYLYGGDGVDIIEGGTGNDVINGSDGNDTLRGGDGHDVLYGRGDDDTLEGGDGNDYLHGGDGDDVLTGGDGADVFVLSLYDSTTNGDTITDFTIGEDTIALMGEADHNYSNLLVKRDGTNTTIHDIYGGESVLIATLEGIRIGFEHTDIVFFDVA